MQSPAKWGFEYTVEHVEKGVVVNRFKTHNLIPQVGVDHMVGLLRGLATPISNWYLGLYSAN